VGGFYLKNIWNPVKRFVSILCGFSLLLFVATSVMWVRSYKHADVVYHRGEKWETWSMASKWGALVIGHREYDGLDATDQGGWHCYSGSGFSIRLPYGQVQWSFWGFSASHVTGSVPPPYAFTFKDRYFSFPFWLLFAICGILPAYKFVGFRQRRTKRQRVKLGLCSACGYDLRSSKERCPECGTAI
jgi:hypothetical protein